MHLEEHSLHWQRCSAGYLWVNKLAVFGFFCRWCILQFACLSWSKVLPDCRHNFLFICSSPTSTRLCCVTEYTHTHTSTAWINSVELSRQLYCKGTTKQTNISNTRFTSAPKTTKNEWMNYTIVIMHVSKQKNQFCGRWEQQFVLQTKLFLSYYFSPSCDQTHVLCL